MPVFLNRLAIDIPEVENAAIFPIPTALPHEIEHPAPERGQLLDEIWPDHEDASQSLYHCIGRLRHYFDDTAKSANYIETVPNLGYRLVAPVYGCAEKPALVRPDHKPSQGESVGRSVYRLLREMRQRKVCRSMMIYTMVIWAVFQVTEIVAPALGLPDWVDGLVVVLGLLGFPVAATLSWIFNLTPAGLVRESKSVASLHPAPARSRMDLMMDFALISVALVLSAALMTSCIG